jgi:hypothetical protein
MLKKIIYKITGYVLTIFLLVFMSILIFIYSDPLLKYEKAWKNKDRHFFIEQFTELMDEKDTMNFLNTLSRISDVTNCYFITPDEFNYEIKQIDDYNVYKENVIFGLSSFIMDKKFFKGTPLFLSKCRKYDSTLTLKEKIEILELIEDH